MAVHVALLRAINVAGHHRVPMADLRARLAEAGYEDVQTLLQSGNVVLSSHLGADALASRLSGELAAWFGFDVPVVVRSRAQLAAVVKRDPFRELATEPRRCVVTFLSGKPDAAFVRRIADGDWGDERFEAHGRELYSFHPHGIQRSKLARLVGDERRLGVTATARNWATVTKLLDLAGG